MDGHWDPTGTAMVEAIMQALGEPQIRVAHLPWWSLRLASIAAAIPRELMEMRYFWQQPTALTMPVWSPRSAPSLIRRLPMR